MPNTREWSRVKHRCLMQINIPDTFTVSVPNGGGTMNVDVTAFSQDVLRNLFAYGLQQKLSDSAADKAKFPDARARLEEMVAQLAEGAWAKKTRSGNPIESVLRAMALGALRSACKVKKVPFADLTKAEKDAGVEKILLAKRAEWMPKAAEIVQNQKVDLSGIPDVI